MRKIAVYERVTNSNVPETKKHFYQKMLFNSNEMQSLDNRGPSYTFQNLQQFKYQLQKHKNKKWLQ